MKTKTFGLTCAFMGTVNSVKDKRITIANLDFFDGWNDPPFDSEGEWMTISKAKKLYKDLGKAIAYAEKSNKVKK